jgi:Arm domain-containing DNA-binding protein/integrase-like protein
MYADGGGLYLQVTPGGASWICRYMLRGRAREMGLGPLALYGLQDARAKALDARRLRHEGVDPIESRRAARAKERLDNARVMTFKQCGETYIKAHRAGWRNAKHAAQWEATLATYAEPIIGGRPVQTIDTALVMKVLEAEVPGAGNRPAASLWTLSPRLRGCAGESNLSSIGPKYVVIGMARILRAGAAISPHPGASSGRLRSDGAAGRGILGRSADCARARGTGRDEARPGRQSPKGLDADHRRGAEGDQMMRAHGLPQPQGEYRPTGVPLSGRNWIPRWPGLELSGRCPGWRPGSEPHDRHHAVDRVPRTNSAAAVMPCMNTSGRVRSTLRAQKKFSGGSTESSPTPKRRSRGFPRCRRHRSHPHVRTALRRYG